MAANYPVASQADLVAAINAANASTDPSSTITLTNNLTFTSATPLPTPTKPLSIDTQGFTLSGPGLGNGISFNAGGGTLTVTGNLYGGDGNNVQGTASNGGVGLSVNRGVSNLINNGTITGGAGGHATTGNVGGIGVGQGAGTFINNGTVTGGVGDGTLASGVGATLLGGGTITNHGSIIGGAGRTSTGGIGLEVTAANGTINNFGTIKGGESLVGTAIGGYGIYMTNQAAASVVNNAGTVEGGTGAIAIYGVAPLNIVNSGAISAGIGQANAIQLQSATRTITLQLQAGSTIRGNVVAGGTANDTLILGGTKDETFDASAIGDTGAQYQNFDIFQKTGTSTWTLTDLGTGAGTADTPWDIQQGTLRIASDVNLGAPTSTLTFSGGALSTSSDVTIARAIALNSTGTFLPDANTTLTLNGTVTGTGGLTQAGAGRLVIPDAKTYTGDTTVDAGTLAINGSITSNVMVDAVGTLGGTGNIIGNLTNAGTVAPGNSIGTLTINGNYIGQGGTLAIEATLDGDASAADRLVITGDTSGTTNVKVTKVGGNGAQTVEGIKIIDVQGASNGTFNLVGDYLFHGQQAVVSGAYAYQLYKNGVVTPTDGDWYLRSSAVPPVDTTPPVTPPVGPAAPVEPPAPLYAPSVPVYEAYANVLQRLNDLATLQQRVGSRDVGADGTGADMGMDGGRNGAVWVRVDGSHANLDPKTSTSNAHYDASTQKAQVGMDFLTRESESGVLVASATAQYGKVTSDVSSMYGLGEIKTKGYGVGSTLTWYGKNGFYVDAQAQYNWYDSDLNSRTLGRSLADGNDGSGFNLGVEAGQKIALGDNLSFIPQGQLTYSSVSFDSFTDPYAARVSSKDSTSFIARAGAAIDHESSWKSADGSMNHAHVYAIANVYYDFLDGAKTEVSGVRLNSENDSLWGGVGLGGSLGWKNDRYKLYGEALAQTSLKHYGDSESYGLRLGFSMSW
ncbi:autotransporter family protein [Luteibacter yeojuensis]